MWTPKRGLVSVSAPKYIQGLRSSSQRELDLRPRRRCSMKFIEKKYDDTLVALLAFLVFLGFALFTVYGQDGLLRLMELKKMRDGLNTKNKAMMIENFELYQRRKSLYDFKTLEKEAKTSLGLIAPDEIVLVLPQ